MSDQLLETCQNWKQAYDRLAEHAQVIKNMGMARVYGVYVANKGGVIGIWLRRRT
jgi:hypothetical protein